jgi:hypothetical protein
MLHHSLVVFKCRMADGRTVQPSRFPGQPDRGIARASKKQVSHHLYVALYDQGSTR